VADAVIKAEKTYLFCDSTRLSQTNSFSLHCAVWGVDCVPWQAYNVPMGLAPCKDWAQLEGMAVMRRSHCATGFAA
jgi:hypothetical protein